MAAAALGPVGALGLWDLCGHSSHSHYVWLLRGHQGPAWPGTDFLEWAAGRRGWKDLGRQRGWWRESISVSPSRGHSMATGLALCELWEGRDHLILSSLDLCLAHNSCSLNGN